MNTVTAIFRDGHLELLTPVDWPNETTVEVKPLTAPPGRVSWLSLPPLDVGEFRELTDDDLLEEMRNDSRT